MIELLNVAITGVSAAYAAACELYAAMRADGNTDNEATHFADLLMKNCLSGGVPLTEEAAHDFNYYWGCTTAQIDVMFSSQDKPTDEECYEADRHMARRLGEDGPYNNC